MVVEKLHVLIKVALHAADSCHISVVFVSLHVQLIQLCEQHVSLKELLSPHKSRIDHIDQQLSLHHVNVHGEVLYAGLLVVYIDLGDPPVVNVKGIVKALIIRLAL